MKKIILFALLLSAVAASGQTADNHPLSEVIYKKIDTTTLKLSVYYPEQMTGKTYPAIIFFFGGGWTNGNVEQFKPHAEYFAKRGIVCFLADYRVKSRHGSTPRESVADAKSAIRFLRANAVKFHIDPDKIVASGGSAGGHLAAATATISKYDDPNDDLNISPRPNALLLFNPAIDLGPGGVAYDWVGEDYIYISPLHNLKQGAPPTAIFLGTKDKLIPVETVQYYQKVMERTGGRCELFLYEGLGHGFFNSKNLENYKQTVKEADEFLISIGFLEGKPTIND
jgi:acetyl esterase/lipase